MLCHVSRTLPYSKRKGVEETLAHLVKKGTLEPVEYSDWAAPIDAVLKSDQTSLRICGDFDVQYVILKIILQLCKVKKSLAN